MYQLNESNGEYALYIIDGIMTIVYGLNWIYRIHKGNVFFPKYKKIQKVFAIAIILMGLSTFFFQLCIFTCGCGLSAGLLKLKNLYYEYKEDSQNLDFSFFLHKFTNYSYGFGIALSFIMSGIHFILCIVGTYTNLYAYI